MSGPVRFVVPGKPCGVNAVHVGGKRPFVKSREARDFADRLAMHGREARRLARWKITDAPVEVAIRVHFDSERPDTDGPVKAILDALQSDGAGFIENDRQVRAYRVERAIDRERPRVEVTIGPVGSVLTLGTVLRAEHEAVGFATEDHGPRGGGNWSAAEDSIDGRKG
jgi:Holliday junction resolvase RusA-like endonuclease